MRATSLRLCLVLCLACSPLLAATIPEAYLGSIPDQIHYFSPAAPTALRLQLKSASLPAPTFSLGNAPAGCAVDAATGIFTYTPAADANCAFEVVVKAVSGKGAESQSFLVTPTMTLAEDVKCFNSPNASFPAPDAESGDYLQVTDTTSDSEVYFNQLNRKPRTAAAAGLVVVFEKGHTNGLYERFCSEDLGNLDLRELTVAAGKVVFRSACRFPGTKLSIFAKELVFEGAGKINTSPLPFPRPAAGYNAETNADAKDGKDGEKGGDLRLLVQNVSVQSSAAGPFLVTTGGQGQNGGDGADGTPGKDVPTMSKNTPWPNSSWFSGRNPTLFLENAVLKSGRWYSQIGTNQGVYSEVSEYVKTHTTAAIFKDYTLGHFNWAFWGQVKNWEPLGWAPGDGGDAKKAGAAGNGGRGGSIDASAGADLDKWRNLDGGEHGDVQTPLPKGGRAGNPCPAFYMEGRPTYFKPSVHDKWYFGCSQSKKIGMTHLSKAGISAAAPKAATLGAAGVFHASYGKQTAHWVHPLAAAQAIKYLKAAYLNGRLDYVQSVAGRWADYLSTAVAEDAWFQYYSPLLDAKLDAKERLKLANRAKSETTQQLGEFQAARSCLASNLDAFGNPAGWTPMVSFELGVAAFRQQVDHAIDTMYLAYWLRKTSANNQAKLDGLWRFRQQAGKKLQAAKDALAQLDATLPTLQARLEEADQLEATTKANLAALDNKFQMDAEQSVFGKRVIATSCKALGMACSVIPVGQPLLGQTGGTLGDMISFGVNGDAAGISTAGLGGLANVFKKSGVRSFKNNLVSIMRKDDFGKYYTPDDTMDYTAWAGKYGEKDPLGDYASGVASAGGDLAKAIKSLTDATGQNAVNDPEVQAEVKRLQEQSPKLKSLGDQVLKLAERKRDAAAELLQACQQTEEHSNQITSCLMAIDSVNQQLVARQAAVSPRLDSYLDTLSRRAEDSLVKYHYLMKKAYEYRMLKEYGADLDLSPLRKRIVQLVEADHAGSSLTDAQFSQLKTLYYNVIWDMCGKLYEDISSLRKATERDTETDYVFHQSQLDALNRGETLDLNLHASGLFGGEQGLRIRDLVVKEMKVSLVPGAPAVRNANFSVYLTHDGVSDLSSTTGETFRFRHYNSTSGDNKLVWGAKYTASTNSITQIVPSVAEASLLKTILTDKGLPHSDADLPLYCWPALDATLHVAKSQENKERKNLLKAAAADGEDSFVITSLVLQVKYSMLLQSPSVRELTVKSDAGASPTILVSPADTLGHGAGRASFSRFYALGSSVTLTAPAQYGAAKFVRWADGQGDSSAFADPTNPVLAGLTIDDDRSVVAKYAYSASGRVTGLGASVAAITVVGERSSQLVYVEDSAQGTFQIAGLPPGSYTLVPSCPGFAFTPKLLVVEIGDHDASNLRFAATAAPDATLTVRGKVRVRSGASWSPFGGAALLLSTADGYQRLAYSSGRDGTYQFDGLPPDAYTLTPSHSAYTFASAAANAPRYDFILVKPMDSDAYPNLVFNAKATPVETVKISVAGAIGVTVTVAGDGAPQHAVTNADGACSFLLTPGGYTFTPSKTGYRFSPASKQKKLDGQGSSVLEFAATPSLTISGRVDGLPPGHTATVRLHLKSGVQALTTTAADGGFAFADVPPGGYILAPAAGGYNFRPQTKAVSTSAAIVFQARRVAVADDFDGDGKADALWSAADGKRHAAKLSLAPFSPCAIIATGDFDGDGVCEVLVRHNAHRGPFWLYSPLTQQRRPLWNGLRTSVEVAAVGDFDFDGDTDILWRDTATGETRLDTALQGWDQAPSARHPLPETTH